MKIFKIMNTYVYFINNYINLYFIGQATYGVKVKPHWKFVWNSYLLDIVDLHPDWLLYIIHGFVGQASILPVYYY